MLLEQKIIDLLNYRIEKEEFSSQLYKAMAVWLEYKGFVYAPKLWYKYSNEELGHAKWAYSYLLDLNVRPCVPEIKKPQVEFSSLIEIIQLSYNHEKEVTKECEELAKECLSCGDFKTFTLAQKYVTEQIEELAKLLTLIDHIETFGSTTTDMKLLDNYFKELL